MKNIKKNLILTFIFAGIFCGASCMKKQNLENDNLGAAIPPEQVAAALSDGFGVLNYDDIKTNEKTSLIVTQKIQDGTPQTLQQQDITIQSVTNSSASLNLDVLATITNYSSGHTDTSTRVWNKVFTKYSGYAFSMSQQDVRAADSTTTNEPSYLFQVVQTLALGSCYDGGSYPESCYNLSTTPVDYHVPPASAAQHNCSDIYNCYIKATQIEFDMLQKYNLDTDGKPQRVHYKLILSPNVPFTARVLEYCSRALYTVDGVPQKVLADICYDVNSYTFGN